MAFRSDLDALVLSVLQSEALHGYEIAKRINAKGETAFHAKEGQLYPILHRLENEGKIQADWIPQEGKPARKVYRLTETGKGELARLIETWREFSQAVNSLMTPSKQEVSIG
ncbi:PadR family transcriptional regulator [Capsulimonas corticalis]|uniref:PadR family transcriptional regulator n=1 Tax=Capsulimonas corticalis TaxID=2219043 RepID=A0A402D099_9BACT|nr:helix-turn-helix transcriptional regulator [Capsulimonas corticalis]BDI33703.1 PadR family transcriptional regulator [Capsulimonas corticalis]